MMRGYHQLAVGMLLFSLNALAQQVTTTTATVRAKDTADLPSAEAQLQVLTGKLGLTADQQHEIKPILQNLHDATERLAEDNSLSREERLAKVRPHRYEADRSIRAMLTVDQIKKLDAYERGPHPEMHGNITGAAPTPPPPKP